MVMEAQPSPQSVGREFVRQYYTLLNQAPAHLHRFYNNNSSFVHGGADNGNREMNPAIGQKQIHQRIQQLNFQDCHAKISQVDSQATLGNGVVVQVSGELSNGGQPMRRFTQTFVLAAQSPKKYYVHNDIFRYQDIFLDEEIEQESGRSEAEDEQVDQEHTQAADMPPQNQTISGYYGGLGVGVNVGVAVNGGTHHDEVPVAPSAPPAPQVLPPPTMMQPGLQQPSYISTVDFLQQQPPQQQQPPLSPIEQQPQPPQQQPQQQVVNPGQMLGQTGMPAMQDMYHSSEHDEEEEIDDEEETPALPEEPAEDDQIKQNLDNYPALDQDHVVPLQENVVLSNEPKTYATLVKSGTTGLNTSPQGPTKSPSSPPPRLESRNNEINLSGGRGQVASRGGPRGGATVRGMSRGNDRPTGPPRPSPIDDGGYGGDMDKRRTGGNPQQHPDNQQLFLGNLPLNVTESDLRDLFGKYGCIIDLRIMSRGNMKGQQPMGKVPNYGFIVFDEVSSVQTILDNRPFYFPLENGTKLNVEEKRARNMRVSMDGRMGSGGDGRGGGSRMGTGGPSLRGGNRGGFLSNRGAFIQRGGGGAMRPGGGPGFNRNTR